MKKLDEKTKTMAVAGLGVVMLGIGAFQFMGKSKGPAHPAVPAKAVSKATAPAPAQPDTDAVAPLNPAYANALPTRDPFTKPGDANATITPPTGKSPVILQPKSKIPMLPSPGKPDGLSGALPPIAPNLDGKGPMGLAPAKAPDPVFQYTLHGVIEGANPAALFADQSGNQRLIPLGKSIDGDSQLVSVGDHGVVVKFHGKNLHMVLGIDPSNK